MLWTTIKKLLKSILINNWNNQFATYVVNLSLINRRERNILVKSCILHKTYKVTFDLETVNFNNDLNP